MSAKPINKIVVLTSGGDAPGMNAALRAVVRTAINKGLEVYAAELGYKGLINEQIFPVDSRFVANCIQRGGTILKTGRFPEFKDKAVRDKCRYFLNRESIDGLIVLGGDGSFSGAATLYSEGGPPTIGIPCTIDNDIPGTDYTIGFDTARNTALLAIDRVRDTAFSLDRHFMIEVMGRSSGFLAVDVGIAGGAEIILIPEFPVGFDSLTTMIKHQVGKKMTSIIVAAEADRPGHTVELAKKVKEATGIEYKVCVLGHIQRGGTPSVKDRLTASLMGSKAVIALLEGQTCKMVGEHRGEIVTHPFPDPKHGFRYFSDRELLRTNGMICEI
jgi:6-phosphofructokinase 1